MRYFIQLSYDGTNYHGWQRQNGAPTIQQTLEEAIGTILQAEISITGCGRTDTGVHASNFYAHFDCEAQFDASLLSHKLNTLLPVDIAVQDVFQVDPEMSSRFDATERTYDYHLHQQKDPFLTNRSYFFKADLNVEAMNKAARHLLSVDDFESFCKANAQNMTNICDVKEAVWSKTDTNLRFTIRANRFLRNMVRAVVGTLLEVGLGKMSIEEFKAVVESKNRSAAGRSVPACGLYLTKVSYPSNLKLDDE